MIKSRRVLSAILAIIMLLPIVLPAGLSFAMKQPGRIDGVDYSRVRENKDLIVPVKFTLGTYQFTGELSNGSTLSNKEIDKIIQEVMDQMDLTSGKLEYSNAIIEKAKHLKGFDPAMALRIGLNIAGYGTVTDIYDMYNGTKPVSSVAASFVIGQISGEAIKLITGAKWADIALNAFLELENIESEWTRLENEKKIAEEALQRELLLEIFYRECNARLQKAEKERGGSQWKMRVYNTVIKNKTLFGIDTMQYVRMTLELERVESYGEKTSTNWSGIYEGRIKIEFWHDMTSFDTNFPTIFTDSSRIFKKVQNVYSLRPESAKDKSSLTKAITINDAQIHIDKRNAVGTTLTRSVPLKGAEDVSSFKLSHVVSYALDLGPWEDGRLDITGSGAHYSAECEMRESCSGTMLEGNRYPAIVWESHDVSAYDSLSAPRGIGWTTRPLPGNGSTRIGNPALADYRIFDDLRDNMLTLWIKDIDKVVTSK